MKLFNFVVLVVVVVAVLGLWVFASPSSASPTYSPSGIVTDDVRKACLMEYPSGLVKCLEVPM